ncbi:HlyD family secretion protein [Hymenobacter ginsengisoli]|uniref:HlyD family secretion protein n=1 Tax=Hymenobacter ginsengisoli TaxID=1051626 RepID=A0ABP8QC26_9BACT|nr:MULTISPECIES: HlyD family secretion protein [unclassified Hymenobacter]MBO2032046.1 HlyD family secretion protein [Hymenobacter sp. BT559]
MATQTELQDAPPTAVAEPLEPEKKRNPLVIIIVALALLVGGYFGWTKYRFAEAHESTDDAQVEGDIYPVLPRVSGPVLKVYVDDNQIVKRGDTLVTIDPADYQQRVDAAQAALLAAQAQVAAARAGVSSAQAGVGTAQANVRTAQTTIGVSAANRTRLQQDLARSTKLRNQDIIPQSEYDAVAANLKATSAQQSTAQDQVSVARNQVAAAQQQVAQAQQQVAVAQAVVKQRQTDLNNAKLQLSYTTIVAPANGIVSRKNVQPGQVVSPGQQLVGLVSSARTWVVANFKETQLENMKVGQPVKLEIDAYPNEEFDGHIESLSAATGARFALLPPDNSTGNFVKVTQRIPVKIVLNKEDPAHPLRTGMSVNAIVAVK